MTLFKNKAVRSIRPLRDAFSLIEVVMAMGVVSFALLSVIGLMPIGLVTMRQAMDQTMEAQIVQQVSTEAYLVGYTNLDSYALKTVNTPIPFDQDGMRQAQKNNQTRFEISLTRMNLDYPGLTPSVNADSSIRAFQVSINRKSGNVRQGGSTNIIYVPNSGN